jgi:hypothetical protein
MADYTGGLNTRGNAFQLANNETPDCLDVDLQIGGGFVQRKVVVPWGTSTPSVGMQNMWTYGSPGTSQQVVGQGTDGKLYWSTGTTWTNISSTVHSGLCTAAEMNGDLYICDGVGAPIRWTGSAGTALGQSWNETIGGEGANDGNMPIAKLITNHMGMMFLASTTESGTAFTNRIRWSHPGFPEDWRQEDFIDIDVGRDNDFITAIIEYRERLYIFKNSSTYELTGYSPATFQVVPLVQDIGCVGPLALCLSDVGLFTFSWPQGVFLDKGTGPYPIFDKIRPMIRDGFIPEAYASKIALAYVNNQNVWCAVPWQAATVNTRVLVYDPWIWKQRYMRFLQGPWYPYSMPISCFTTLVSTSAGYQYLAAHSSAARVGQLEQIGVQDNWGGGTTSAFQGYYRTDWFDLGQEAVFKRWRHPEFVVRTGTSSPIQVDVYRDYDPTNLSSTYFIQPATAQGGNTLVWATGLPATTPTNVVATATSLGTNAADLGYVVTATVSGVESQPSAEADVSMLGFPGDTAGSTVTITWSAVASATAYHVYGRVQGGTELLLGSTASLTFTDTGQALGTQSPPVATPQANTWDDGTGNVGGLWSNPIQQGESIVKGMTMGRARAIQMVLTGPAGSNWGLDALTLKVIPERIHG